MGRKNKNRREWRHQQANKAWAKQPHTNERNYNVTPKDNKLFLEFYSGLGLMPKEEVPVFYNQMKEPLPVTFRITGYKSQAKDLLKVIRTDFFDKIMPSSNTKATSTTTSDCATLPSATEQEPMVTSQESQGPGALTPEATVKDGGSGAVPSEPLDPASVKPPKCLSWYPDELAWQIDLSRKMVRSHSTLTKLHLFLVSETETGNISRQEAVSMIPPLVLDVQPNSKVLDLCAAPGSKTAQLIEYLHKDENCIPEGVVVANDKDNKRCYLMVHQVKRLSSPCFMIVNHDATLFPKLKCSPPDAKPEFMLFDRVLADVPCSGDGTMRKNVDIWKKWTPYMGNCLHGTQLKILKRGLELLEVGGRLVYSTCSLQPVEDEAVIAEMLRRCQGSVELVDISPLLPGLKTVPGLKSWKLMTNTGQWLSDVQSVPPGFKDRYTQSMFPPEPKEAEAFNLHLCHRILPHHQDTGGFFVAALRKVSPLPWTREGKQEKESAATGPSDAESGAPGHQSAPVRSSGDQGSLPSAQPQAAVPWGAPSTGLKRKAEEQPALNQPVVKAQKVQGFKEDPFIFLASDDPIYPPIREFYGLSGDFPSNQLLYRSETGLKRTLYFVNQAVRRLVQSNDDVLRFVNMGVKFVSRSPSPLVPDCDYRIAQECLGSVCGQLTKRKVTVTAEDAVMIFKEENPFTHKMSPSTKEQLNLLSPGSVVFIYKHSESDAGPECELVFCGWRGKTSVRSFVSRHERSHCLRLFGLDLDELSAEVNKKKAERAKRWEMESASSRTTAASDPDIAPADPDPTLADPDPTPADLDPTPADPDPTPADPDPTPADLDPTPGDPDPTSGDPDPTLGDPDLTRGDPDLTASEPAPAMGDTDTTVCDLNTT